MDNSLGLCACCHVLLPVLLSSSITAACHCRSGLSMTVLLLPSSYQVPGLLSHLGLTTISWGNSIFTFNLQTREPKLTKWLTGSEVSQMIGRAKRARREPDARTRASLSDTLPTSSPITEMDRTIFVLLASKDGLNAIEWNNWRGRKKMKKVGDSKEKHCH